jgi:hypothetical protein
MNHSTTAQNLGLATPATRPVPIGALLASALRALRAIAGIAEATPDQIVARDVANVRAMADSWRSTDPGFASDLYAAASRHELTLEEAAHATR